MITNNYFLNLNIDQGDIQETDIKIVQNDYNANTFDIHIFNGDVEIDYTDVDSGIIIFRNAYKDIVKQGNLVKGADKFTYTLESINFDGDCICGVQLYGVNDERISTTYFKIKIVRDLISEKSVKTDSNYDALLALKNDLETIDVVDLRNDILSHQAESASKHIHSSGSNTNGRYIKFDDGTMICTKSITITGDIIDNSFTNTQTWASTFIDRNIAITVTSRNPETANFRDYFRQIFITPNTTTVVLRIVPTTGQSMTLTAQPFDIVGIGRWKA